MAKEQYKPENPASSDSDAIVVPTWWRWDPTHYDNEKYPAEPPMDDSIWEQPIWEKPIYKHPDGWTPAPPMDKPDVPPMHYKPWEPKPEAKPHHEAQSHQHQHHEHDHKDYVPPHHHDIPPHIHLPPEYPEPQNPNNININIDIDNSSNANANSSANASAESVAKAMSGSLSFAASHNHYGEHIQYHEDCDELFDWGEATYTNIMPTHKESYAIEDYYARIYDNGQAVGEKNGNIYHYDGNEINYVGTMDEIAGWAGIELMA